MKMNVPISMSVAATDTDAVVRSMMIRVSTCALVRPIMRYLSEEKRKGVKEVE